MRIAVVGSGIAGLGAAWALSQRHDVTLYEADSRVGGHAHTVDVHFGDRSIPVDTGFIVYNEPTYPHLSRLFDHLGVATKPSDMSFAFSRDGLEYAGSLRGMLANTRQLRSSRYRSMIGDILRFRRIGTQLLAESEGRSLAAVLDDAGFSEGFRDDYIVPMAAAIWSARRSEILDFPASSFLQFFRNHGLIRISDRPPWQTVQGGSRSYVDAIVKQLGSSVRLDSPVHRIDRISNAVLVHSGRSIDGYDQIVLATHSDQALSILGDDASDDERDILKSIRYEDNVAVLHSDPTLMPRNRKVWSSWNYVTRSGASASQRASVTYWMNRLQSIDPANPLFVSLNPHTPPSNVHGIYHYAHPQFDHVALDAQRRIPRIQGVRHTWFAGAWCGYGFHEDGLQSGLAVAAALGSPAPWHEEVVPMSSAPGPHA